MCENKDNWTKQLTDESCEWRTGGSYTPLVGLLFVFSRLPKNEAFEQVMTKFRFEVD